LESEEKDLLQRIRKYTGCCY